MFDAPRYALARSHADAIPEVQQSSSEGLQQQTDGGEAAQRIGSYINEPSTKKATASLIKARRRGSGRRWSSSIVWRSLVTRGTEHHELERLFHPQYFEPPDFPLRRHTTARPFRHRAANAFLA